ncbi:response regulator [Caballeronia sp. LZ016]|uniref:response regulator n=1 Tax=Caballeronia sp. LZ016 TaxID=3038554 RepID=UPI00285FFA0F|nr:response regulator [Caballeronia sp. LZ016]MDR5740204.1 response regulator [Caballeronia sp. LZ016]
MPGAPAPLLKIWNPRPFACVSPPVAVLIVDDDIAGAEALAAALATEGIRTIVADGGTSALVTPPAWTPHVVILDIEMPACDGFGVALAMRGSRRFANTPIIAYTSLDETDVIERGKEAEIDAFHRKGDPLRCLLRLIDHLAPGEAAKIP